MDPSRADRILEEWSAVAHRARRPATSPRRARVVAGGLPAGTLAGATLVVVAVVIAGTLFTRQAPTPDVGGSPSTAPVPTASTATATESTAPATNALCDPTTLSVRITLWEGAAGSRIAHLELTNAGSAACVVESVARPQLVDRSGTVLINGPSPTSSTPLSIGPRGVLTTLVEAGNYCGPAPQLPVSVAFVMSDGKRVVAAPRSATDTTIPPCMSSPGAAGTIGMHPWSR
jgi:hypothetical protein